MPGTNQRLHIPATLPAVTIASNAGGVGTAVCSSGERVSHGGAATGERRGRGWLSDGFLLGADVIVGVNSSLIALFSRFTY